MTVWQTPIKHFEQQTSVFCVLSCILFIQKSSSLFHTEQSCDRLKFETSAAQEKKMIKKKKTHLGQVFQSFTISFET